MSRRRLPIIRRSAAAVPASSSPMPPAVPSQAPVIERDSISLSSIPSPPPSPVSLPSRRNVVSHRAHSPVPVLPLRGSQSTASNSSTSAASRRAELERRLQAAREDRELAELEHQIATEEQRAKEIRAKTRELGQAPSASSSSARRQVKGPAAPRARPRQLEVSEDEEEEKEDDQPGIPPARLQLSNRDLDADEDLATLSYDVNRFPLTDESSVAEIAARALRVAGEIGADQLTLTWHSQNEHGNNRADKDIISLVGLEGEAALDRVKKTLLARARNKHAASSGGIWLLTAIEVMRGE